MELRHITIATRSRGPLFASTSSRLAAMRGVVHSLGDHLVLFCFVDDHLHLVVLATRKLAGRLSVRPHLALRPHVASRLAPAHISEIESRKHLFAMVRYCTRQSVKHGLPGHPAAWTGSCLADLVGLRRIDGFATAALEEHLPRLTIPAVLSTVELDPSALDTASTDALRRCAPADIVAASASVLAVLPDDPTALGTTARSIAATLLYESGLATPNVAAALDVSARGARWLRSRPVEPELIDMARRRITFDRAVAAAPPVRMRRPEQHAQAGSAF